MMGLSAKNAAIRCCLDQSKSAFNSPLFPWRDMPRSDFRPSDLSIVTRSPSLLIMDDYGRSSYIGALAPLLKVQVASKTSNCVGSVDRLEIR